MVVRSRVLFVEGAAIVREPIEAALAAAGVDVIAVPNGRELAPLLVSEAPGLLVIDLDLPGEQGWLALAQARSSAGWARAPVIVLSSQCDRATVVRAAKYRVDGFVVKSKFSLPAFVERVRSALAGGPAAGVKPRSSDARSEEGGGASAARVTAAAGPADPAEALKSIRPILTRSEVAECVDRCEQLRAFSPTVAMLLKITSNKDCSMERVVKAASHDQAITLKILKLANSVAYGRGDPVDSLKSAVMRIGLDKIRQAVMNIGLIEQFDGGPASVNLPHFWEHAIGCAVVSADLAHATGQVDPESAFTAGLIHDVGRIVLLEQLGERYAAMVEKAKALRLPLEQVESRMLLVNHADVMDRLLHAWKFSRHLINPVVFHHLSAGGIRKACPREVGPVSVLALANRLTHAMLLGSSGNDFVYPTAELCQALRVDGEALAGVCDRGPAQTLEIKVAMLTQSSGGAWKSFRELVRDGLRAPFRPLFASAEPALDAYRVLSETLAGPAASDLEAPNLGVVHLASAKDIVTASTRYATAEKAAGCGRLPLIVVSPLGQLNVEPGLADGRTVVPLPSPLSVHQFVETLNSLLASERVTPALQKAA